MQSIALASSPNTVGVPVFDTVREHQHPPLGVEFEVIDANRRVFVLTCWDTLSGRSTPTGNCSPPIKFPHSPYSRKEIERRREEARKHPENGRTLAETLANLKRLAGE